jgi:hypothetical protein
MSSDESDHENRTPHYHVLLKQWRSPILVPWLHHFDKLHLESRFAFIAQGRRGCPPHGRVRSIKTDPVTHVVHSLPKNAYNPSWLTSLSENELELLQPQDEYDFLHNNRSNSPEL